VSRRQFWSVNCWSPSGAGAVAVGWPRAILAAMLLPPFFFSIRSTVGQPDRRHWFSTGVIWKHLAITRGKRIRLCARSIAGVAVGSGSRAARVAPRYTIP